MKVRTIGSVVIALSMALLLPACCQASEPTPVESAHPMIGTAEHGHVYPGATVPFGMVQLSPDTRLETWDGCSGYHYSDHDILGFSHTHLSGTGCGDLGDIRVTPLDSSRTPAKQKDGYHAAFSHDDETARPGYYSVVLKDPKIKVELTASAHSGFHRYTFPADASPQLVFDLDRGISNRAAEGSFTMESPTIVSGYRRSHGWAADKTFYFAAEFSRPIQGDPGIEIEGKAAVKAREGKGPHVAVKLDFQRGDEPLLVKIGISAVSEEAARKNLAAEIPAWDFAGTIAAAEKLWADYLGRIEIQTADTATRETFYTASYHAAMAPTLFADVDGTYRGLDHKVHPASGFQNYCTFSLWDTFRAEHPLLTIVQPQRVDDFVNTMLAHYRQFKQHSLPVWSLAGNETWCMIGNHSIPVIVDAYAKGFRGFDAEAAYQAMRDTVMQNRNFQDEYRKRGFVPSADNRQSVSRTMEYAYDDWCIAQMALMLGKSEDAKLFAKRAQNYRNVIDTSIGFARGVSAEGKWHTPFDPRELVWADYTEATSWNYTWFVLHDMPGLIQMIGGDQSCIDKLDKMFAEDSKLLANIPDLTGLIGQYIQGNEPCHHVAYLYSYAGAPWKTQQRIRQVMNTLYDNHVGGICGNDDCGQMSAWYVLSALGIYPVNPVSGVYVLGSPLVDRATIHLDTKYHKGGSFTLIAKNNSPQNMYIQSASLNGKPLTHSWISHDDVVGGGELILEMGPQPNKAWGQRSEDRPPAVAPGRPTAHADIAQPGRVTLTSGDRRIDMAYAKAARGIEADVQDGSFLAGQNWAQVWTRDTSFSVDMACALLHPEVSKNTLLGLREEVPGIGDCWYQDKCGHFAGWPNLTDAIVGASGAWQLYLVTGDRSLLKPVYIRTVNSLKRAERDAWNEDFGLFGGCATFMESNSGYPGKYGMKGSMIAKTYALSTNLLYYRGYVIAARLAELLGEDGEALRAKAEKLKRTINARLWMPDKGYYAHFLDADGKLDERMEGTGEAFAILYHVADAEQARQILKKTPTTASGCPCLWPPYPEWQNYRRDFASYYHDGMIWPFVQGYWAWAASQAQDVDIFDRELQSLVRLSENSNTFMEFYFPEDGKPGGSPRQLWSASGFLSMIYHGLFGMDFQENGIRFSPVVPKNLHHLTLTRVKYRNCLLSITIEGNGTTVDQFKLDGQQVADAFLDGSLSGEHQIEIRMK
jgi:predicted alpha-1,2-mannosidase